MSGRNAPTRGETHTQIDGGATCAAAFCGEPALALEVADTIPLSEQRDILGCILRDYTYRRNPFWKELLTIPWD